MISKLVNMGEWMPNYYRTAYYIPWTRQFVCYPIGIHWIVRFFRRCWELSYRYKMSQFEQVMIEICSNSNINTQHDAIAAVKERLKNEDSNL